VSVDIESIKDQLAKDLPSPGVVKQLWTGIETVVTASEFVGIVASVGHLIHTLFH
jgi:hypothetical protein